jgi:ribosomal protein S26
MGEKRLAIKRLISKSLIADLKHYGIYSRFLLSRTLVVSAIWIINASLHSEGGVANDN